MTDKELRHLSRKELLELLIEQMEENERLQKALDAAVNELENRKILIDRSGSIAEAALGLHRIFEQADAAAKEYLENVRRMAETQSGSDTGENEG